MGGCCSPSPRSKYKDKSKGICNSHEHLLIYSYEEIDFTCNNCHNNFHNFYRFYCRTCKYSLCSKCFDKLGGYISNKFQVNQKGKISMHNHSLCYEIPNSNYTGFKCFICEAVFLKKESPLWNCPKCEKKICDKCFIEYHGELIQ